MLFVGHQFAPDLGEHRIFPIVVVSATIFGLAGLGTVCIGIYIVVVGVVVFAQIVVITAATQFLSDAVVVGGRPRVEVKVSHSS